MPNLAIPLSAVLATGAGALQPVPAHGVTLGHTCQTAGTEQFIGRRGDSMTGAAIKRISKAAVLRWGLPGHALTMDFRFDRVTIFVDPTRKITKISCG